MQKTHTLIVVALAALAGCLDGGANEADSTNAADVGGTNAPPDGGIAEATGADAGPLPLYLAADGTFVAAPPEAGWVAYPEAVNSPFATEHLAWSGTLPRGGNLTTADVPITLYLTSSSANLAARLIPPFTLEDLPGLFVWLEVGEASWFVSIPGPDMVMTGDVLEAAGILVYQGDGAPPTLRPGDPVQLDVEAAYAHVKDAAELRFVVGTDHPAAVTLGL